MNASRLMDGVTSSPATAMERVFSVTELMESILLHLDMATLLLSVSRVNKTWNAFINHSTPIQKALFLHPAPPDREEPGLYDSSRPKPTINPLLKHRFGHCFFETGLYDGHFFRANSFYSMPWTFEGREAEPVQTSPPSPEESSSTAVPCGPQLRHITPLEFHRIRVAGRKFRRRGASWRNMFVCQPPPRHFGFAIANEYASDQGTPLCIDTAMIETQIESQPSNGLRMGTLYDFVQDQTGHHDCPSAWFRVVWGQPREPFLSRVFEAKCRELLQETSVLVEVAHLINYDDLPRDVAEFDKHFRSRAYRQVQVNDSQRSWDESEYPIDRVVYRLMVD